jgi:hypothetical protein
MPPLRQYFSRLPKKKADESIPAPKERESWTPGSSSLQIRRFLRLGMGAMMLFMDPSAARHLLAISVTAA